MALDTVGGPDMNDCSIACPQTPHEVFLGQVSQIILEHVQNLSGHSGGRDHGNHLAWCPA